MKPKLIGTLSFLILLGCQSASGLIDHDGNIYPTAKYGETIWMMANLKVRHDRSGNQVVYYSPNEDTSNIKIYGLLYDYATACEVCPEGWRLPTNPEWENLFQLSEQNKAGKYKDREFWEGETNSNSCNFSVRPAGLGNNGEYQNHFGDKTLFWSATKDGEHFIWTFILEKGKDSIRIASQHPTYAFSVRCVKNSD
ncbi:MAG: hypothetical protein HEP71_13150 [Roseivirga sp.]|nr:hypothetical protein [Roseivirga sp.]